MGVAKVQETLELFNNSTNCLLRGFNSFSRFAIG